MKAFFNVFSTVFLLVGAVVGAGFISGSELVVFFGKENFTCYVIFSCVFFILALLLAFSFAGREDFNCFNARLFGASSLPNYAVAVSNFLLCVSMLAGLDSVWNTLGVLKGFPILSTLTLVGVSFFSKFGIKGLEKFSLILTPVVILAVNITIFSQGTLTLPRLDKITFTGLGKGALYCALNVFICLPVLFGAAQGKNKKELILSSIIGAVLIFSQAIVVLLAVDDKYLQTDMPLYYTALKTGFPLLLFFSLTLGTITATATSYFSVYQTVNKRFGKKGIIAVGLFLFLFSRFGLKAIIKYAYPLIGGIGFTYIVKMTYCSIKESLLANNKKKGENLCLRKRIKTK